MQQIIELYNQVVIQIATPYSTGTGFYLEAYNLIITNEHVVRGNRKVILKGPGFDKQMSHVFVNHKAKSIWLKELDELFDKLNAKEIYRAKANLILNANKKTVGGWHYDNQVDKDIKIAK